MNPYSRQADALVGWWPATVMQRALWPDMSGHGNVAVQATAAAMPTAAGDPAMGRVATFDGNDWSERSTAPSTRTDNWTLSVWMQPWGATALNRMIVYNGTDAGGYGLVFGPNGTSNKLGMLVGGVAWVDSGLTVAAAYEWIHYTAVRRDGTIYFYKNGMVSATTSASIPNAIEAAFAIGREPGKVRYFLGAIADVRIYDRALSNADVWQLWAPQTRWELYLPARRLWVGSTAAAPPAPDAPTALTATATASDTIELEWSDNSDDETGFSVERGTDGVTFAEIDTTAGDAESYEDDSCEPDTLYYYRVRAYNGAGYSAYTDVASAKTAPEDAALAYQYLVIDGGQVTQTDGRYVALVDGVPEPDTVVGVAWLYVDQDDGDLKVKFGDGTVVAVAADT